MRIETCGRNTAERRQPEAGAVVISIRSRGTDAPNLSPGWEAVLTLQFDDCAGDALPPNPISIWQARDAVEFAERHRDAPLLLIHCEVGASRSVSLAMALSELVLGLPRYRPAFFDERPDPLPADFIPNRQVYGMVMEVLERRERLARSARATEGGTG